MINPPPTARTDSALVAEVTAMDMQARNPLLLLVGSAIVWLLVSGVLGLIWSIQLHTPGFLTHCECLTFGRTQALQESAFIYGWCANAGLAVGLFVLGRLGGYPLRALNWVMVGAVFWNLAVTAGMVGIATGDMTSFALLQMPRYVQPALVCAYAAMAISGVLAWSGRRTDGTYASQWYAVAALFLFPWLLIAAQAVLLWPDRAVGGTAQAVAANWYGQGVWSLWLAPLALSGAYYIVPKVAGRALPTYEAAPLGFWTLIYIGAWTGGRHLVGGPVPAWVATIAVVTCALLLFHYVVVALNFRIIVATTGNAIRFIRLGLAAYLIVGAFDFITSFRGVAEQSQFTLLATAIEQFGRYGGLSMMFFGAIYYLVPRVAGTPWASAGMLASHRVLVVSGITVLVATLAVAGGSQAGYLLEPKTNFATIFSQMRLTLLMHILSQMVLLAANLLFLVNFCRTAFASVTARTAASPSVFRPTSALEAPASP